MEREVPAMGKIICDICGTTYQDTAQCCPICGCSRETAAGLLGDDLLLEDTLQEETRARGGRFSAKKKKEIFDFDEANSQPEEPAEESNPYEEDYQEPPRRNTAAVVVLTVLIALLLGAAAFLFVRYYLPNLTGQNRVTVSAEPTTESTTAPTTEPGIPCQSLALTSGTASGTAELTQEGQYFLLHVLAMPENTTDPIEFASADETIATVTQDGRITAVGEGETVIYITCGAQQLTCPVVCRFAEPTQPTTVATVPDTTAEDTQAAETTAPTTPPDVELKLKRTDIRLGVYYQYQLELDCELAQDAVEWTSEHPHIATVDENGVVTAVKAGTTSITAKYGDQEVSCIVRCFTP